MRGFLQHQLQLEADCHWFFTEFWKINNGILQDHHNRWEYNLSQRVWQIWMATRLCLVLQPAGESQQGTTSKHDNSTVQHHQLYDHADFWILRIGAVTVSQWNNKNSFDGTLQSQPHRFGCNTNKRPWKNQGTSKALNMVEKCSTQRKWLNNTWSRSTSIEWSTWFRINLHRSNRMMSTWKGLWSGKRLAWTQHGGSTRGDWPQVEQQSSWIQQPSADCNRSKTTKPLQLDFQQLDQQCHGKIQQQSFLYRQLDTTN